MKKATFSVEKTWGLGDAICGLIAVREWARVHRDTQVYYGNLPELVRKYGDGLVRYSDSPGHVFDCWHLHRARWWSPCWNYLGTYLADIGLPIDGPPDIRGRLPSFPRPAGLPKLYSVIVPYASFALPNAPAIVLEEIVRKVRDNIGGFPCYCLGKEDTPKDIDGVDYSRLGTPLSLLAMVQHATLVLTARSVTTNVAPAYGVPAVVWAPDDGENWNMRYPGWQKAIISIGDPDIVEHAVEAATSLLAWRRQCST